MLSYYRILRKKSIPAVVLAGFLLFAVPVWAKIPNDPEYAKQQKMWEAINAPAAWDYTTGSRQVTVAVIDTGADTWHDDLAANIWRNPYEVDGNGLDDDNNGFIDDINGWNFVENNNDARTSVFVNQDDPESVRHGTIVAGLVGAVGDNGKNGTGINWQVRIMPLRAMASDGSGDIVDVVKAVNYAVNNGAQVISMSMVGGMYSGDLENALYQAYKKGIVVVVAAGNEGFHLRGDLDEYPLYPACFDKGDKENWMLTVTAVNLGGRLSAFADYGSCVDLSAPGEGVYSTERYAPQYGYLLDFGGPWKGTSFSTPLVAGAAALLKAARPDFGPREIIDTLLSTADNLDAFNIGYVGKMGRGRLNAGAALATASVAVPAAGGGTVRTTATAADGQVYYHDQNAVMAWEVLSGTVRVFGSVADAQIVAVAGADLNGDDSDEVVVLLKREPFFYLRFLKHDGSFWHERPVGLDEIKSGLAPVAIQIIGGADPQYVLDYRAPKKNSSRLVLYDNKLNILSQTDFKSAPARWTADSDRIVAAVLSKKKLTLTQYDWEGNKQYTWSRTGVDAVDDLKFIKVWSATRASSVLLYRRGKNAEQAIVDLSFSSATVGNFAAVSAKDKQRWRLFGADLNAGGLYEILHFRASGGDFAFTTAQSDFVSSVTVPVLKGILD